MTKKVFWQDPYLTELDTTVKTVQGNQITVNETIFMLFLAAKKAISAL